MESLEKLAKKLLDGKEITLHYKKYNDGTKETPDIFIHRVYAHIKTYPRSGAKDIIVYLSKEDENTIFDTDEVYRMPVIEDLKVLNYVLKEVRKQSHWL